MVAVAVALFFSDDNQIHLVSLLLVLCKTTRFHVPGIGNMNRATPRMSQHRETLGKI